MLTFDNFTLENLNKIPRDYTFTFAMIKPNAVKSNYTGGIIKMIEDEGFEIYDIAKRQLPLGIVEHIYRMHSEKDFFHDLCDYIASGPVVLLCVCLKKEDGECFEKFRNLMTREGGIRDQFGVSQRKNAIHGSDSEDNAKRELKLLMKQHHRY